MVASACISMSVFLADNRVARPEDLGDIRMAEGAVRIFRDQPVELALRLRLRNVEVDAGHLPVAHRQASIDEHRPDDAPRTRHDERLHGVEAGSGARSRQIEHRDIGLAARGEAADIVALQRPRPAERGRIVHFRRAAGIGPPLDDAAEHQADRQVQDHVGRRGVGAEGDVDSHVPARPERSERRAAARRDHRAMHDGDAMIAVKRQVLPRRVGGVRREQPVRQHAQLMKPLRRRSAVQPLHRLQLHRSLRCMQPHRDAALRGRPRRPLQQVGGAGLDPVRREQGAHQPAAAVLVRVGKGNCRFQPGKAALLVEEGTEGAVPVHDHPAGAEGRAEIDAQTHFLRRLRRRLEFADGFAPLTVEQRGDGRGGGDAVQQELGEGIALLERQLLRGVHFIWPPLDIGDRPDPALAPCGLIVEAEHGRVEVRQGVEIDEAGADQGMAEFDPARRLERTVPTDMQDPVLFEQDAAILVEDMPAIAEPHHPAGAEPGRASRPLSQPKHFEPRVHGASRKDFPARATTRPRLTTRARGARETTASASVLPSTSTRSAWHPGASPYFSSPRMRALPKVQTSSAASTSSSRRKSLRMPMNIARSSMSPLP
jgi:hypothetical protein